MAVWDQALIPLAAKTRWAARSWPGNSRGKQLGQLGVEPFDLFDAQG